ncbi:hypothetical protein AJ80_04823 [Polytolypa hystricis UAMH7299]|uniref:CHY-type domain-containing protein n=1 Tax=Polytolypa hystricis (strain UAMH7299) TaxID=1447883 RepID=A0A2B7Y8X7_POLH7|nr:hypothetical protein AJ80_04823 [Polytolypa hystricis UAMH7299]
MALNNNISGQPPPVHAELASAQPHPIQASTRPPPARRRPDRKSTKCRFFGTKEGCRAGNACPFAHDSSVVLSPEQATQEHDGAQNTSPLQGEHESVAAGNANVRTSSLPNLSAEGLQSRVVQRPIPRAQIEDPRGFQINQIRRRFNPDERSDEYGTYLTFKLVPSDPDFSFDVNSLECVLQVPLTYPNQGKPSLEVKNAGLDSKYKMLVQQKFNNLATNYQGTLLTLMNVLDKSLRPLFSGEPSMEGFSSPNETFKASSSSTGPAVTHIQSAEGSLRREKERADQRRQREVSQLTSRLRRTPLFSASSDKTTFTIPLRPAKPQLLPDPLKSLGTVNLVVSPLYPLEPCRIRLTSSTDQAARNAEVVFEKHVVDNPDMTILAHMNYLSAMLHTMVNPPVDEISDLSNAAASVSLKDTVAEPSAPPVPNALPELSKTPAGEPDSQETSADRPHIRVIPRPPEWTLPGGESDEDESELSSEYDSEGSFTDEDEAGGVRVPAQIARPVGRESSLDFPSLDLVGIELLQLKSLSLTLKCERCKELHDFMNIKIGEDGLSIPPKRVESCKKCGYYLSIGFRRELMHPYSHRAGYLDLDGCTAADFLPSSFIPTCSECSAIYPAPGITAVAGDSKSAVCRQCHHGMRFKLPEIKFLLVRSGVGESADNRNSFFPKESLGIVAGQELPRRGRCAHYGKSYRWFRFSCCARVFSCDRCHDAATDHPNEHANRMICGFCSREQNYRPEDCGVCHSILVGKAGSGFWEGGKGTRDRARMSKKDPRKYKRKSGTTPGSSTQKK